MIELHDLERGLDYSTLNSTSIAALEPLRRLLYLTARRYNQTCQELDNIKAASGFDKKPFRLLHLPPEIRNKIYLYAFEAPMMAETIHRQTYTLAMANYPFKPPAPGLLRTNKRVYQEAIEILYSKNIFKFNHPREFLDFEEQIGASNRQLIRSVCIFMRFEDEEAASPELLPISEYDSVPPHWVKALQQCRLEKVIRLEVQGMMFTSGGVSLLSMPANLQQSIDEILSREKDTLLIPRLTLRGFGSQEFKKFPENWEIITDQWEAHEKEQEGLGEELLWATFTRLP